MLEMMETLYHLVAVSKGQEGANYTPTRQPAGTRSKFSEFTFTKVIYRSNLRVFTEIRTDYLRGQRAILPDQRLLITVVDCLTTGNDFLVTSHSPPRHRRPNGSISPTYPHSHAPFPFFS